MAAALPLVRSPSETCCHLLPIWFWPQVPAETRAALSQCKKLERCSERSIAASPATERAGSGARDKNSVFPSHPADVPPSLAPQHTEPHGAGRGSPMDWDYFAKGICPQASPVLAAGGIGTVGAGRRGVRKVRDAQVTPTIAFGAFSPKQHSL